MKNRQKKNAKRLDARIADWEQTMQNPQNNRDAFPKPGSQNPHKTYGRSKRR